MTTRDLGQRWRGVGVAAAGLAAAGLWGLGGSAGAAPVTQSFTTPGTFTYTVPASPRSASP